MGRVTVKNWPIGWREDSSFSLPDEKCQELVDITCLEEDPGRAGEMLEAVRRALSMYPSMVKALDKGPRPAHKRAFLEPLIEHAKMLVRGLLKRDEEVWEDMTYLKLPASRDMGWALVTDDEWLTQSFNPRSDLTDDIYYDFIADNEWWDAQRTPPLRDRTNDTARPGFRSETDGSALVGLLEKFLLAARHTRKRLNEQESRHGPTLNARTVVIDKLERIFDTYQAVPPFDLHTNGADRLNIKGLRDEFVKTALEAAGIPHPADRLKEHNPSKGCTVKKFRSRARFSRLTRKADRTVNDCDRGVLVSVGRKERGEKKVVVYTWHARLRMQQRKITEAEVEAVLQNPSYSYTDRDGNPIHVGRPGGRRVKVVVVRGSSPPVIKTAAD